MKKLLTLILILCAVVSLATPVSADYYWEKDVSADDFVNALVAYSNHNEVHNMTEPEFELSAHDFRSYNVVRTNTTLDFDYECKGTYVAFGFLVPLPIAIPIPTSYKFTGHMHVDNPDKGLGNLYGLTVSKDDRKFTACGLNWILTSKDWDGNTTRFYVNEDEPNRLYSLKIDKEINKDYLSAIYRPS